MSALSQSSSVCGSLVMSHQAFTRLPSPSSQRCRGLSERQEVDFARATQHWRLTHVSGALGRPDTGAGERLSFGSISKGRKFVTFSGFGLSMGPHCQCFSRQWPMGACARRSARPGCNSFAAGGQNVSDERAVGAVDRKLGERVRARRLEIGMSQERLAELLGVTFQQVQKYEKGVNRMAA